MFSKDAVLDDLDEDAMIRLRDKLMGVNERWKKNKYWRDVVRGAHLEYPSDTLTFGFK